MGRQSSRLIYREKDHKDIFFQGKYHKAMYLGNKLLWKKLQKLIPFISFDGDKKVMCINLLDVDSKAIKKIVDINGVEFSDDKLVRGDNSVGYFIKDASWAFSEDGQNFIQTERMGNSITGQMSAYAGYALTKSCFLGTVTDGERIRILSYDIETFDRYGTWGGLDDIYGHLYSGIVNPKLDLYIARNGVENSWRYGVSSAKMDGTGYAFSYSSTDGYRNILGADNKYVYAFFYASRSLPHSRIERYDYITKDGDWIATEVERDFYMNIRGSFYKNGKFIVYCAEGRSIGDDGRLQIYTTTDFLNFTAVSTPRSIVVQDMDSDGEYTISFDSSVSGDVYIHPACSLDNTYYFDEDGVMHDDDGCLFHTNINETGFKKIVTIYFDNHYFRESENNFCQILIFEEEDIEPPLFE